jgi:hypothetical protein
MADDARTTVAGEHRFDLMLSAELNSRIEAWMATMLVRPSKSEAIRTLLIKGLAEVAPAIHPARGYERSL